MTDPAPIQNSPVPLDASAVLAWYDRHARALPWRVPPRDRARGVAPDPYRIWLSEVMLQQTTIAAVIRYYERFTTLWPTVEDLASAPLDAVLVEWAGLGYYARARNLHACAEAVVARHGGRFPQTAAVLASLPGIGAYTSAAIAAIAEDEPIAVVDGNVERLLARYLALPVPVREAKDLIRAQVQAAVPSRSGDFAQALMDLGATICAPKKALCMLCPLQSGCAGTRTGNPLAFPVRAPKPERPTRYGHAYVILDETGDVYLRARADKGLLAKMTETPTGQWEGQPGEPDYPFPASWRHRGQIVHVFTHFRLELEVWSATATDPAALAEGWWVNRAELDSEALPSVFRKVLAIGL
ncbi:A/G-specific adenine glycosylase [Arsenicitalea aurantiaca]|uniref:Adenine DNA glycosylase n=1 Tax=Arsenicitalea aurantiaca TaxID=1783274 RepID=A0A433XAS4_9HYPH|nr:A/G-specific adenine glycosylase [Arsenicitalea aurantiaca]RUT31154.1 A/G-specific adenine glycosylase [Arsenicitalea aurantiaca]